MKTAIAEVLSDMDAGIAALERRRDKTRAIKHSSRPFNPNIANAFFHAGQIEAWGRGIQRIIDACREAGTPEPLITYDPGNLWLEFPFAPAYLAAIEAEQRQKPPVETPVETLGKTQQGILQSLRDNPGLTVPEVAQRVSKSVSAVQRAMLRLQEAGRLRRGGSRKAGHWEIIE